jgi:sugar phosphate isomerase/epimerase
MQEGLLMPDSVIAAQLYTVREFTKTPADIASTMKKVKAIGYDVVQTSGLGPIEAEELRKIVDGEGLTICATHVGYESLRDDVETQIDYHKTIGCDNVAIGGLPGDYRSTEGFARFAKEGTEIGRKLADAGLTFSYHNHSHEFEKFDGRLAMDIIYEDSDPRYLKAELDTYWVQHGGGDSVAWIDKLSDRIVLLHLKDMAIRERKQVFAEIGEGNLNWDAILKAAKAAGTQWYIVEQDTCQRDPFESLKISLENLKAMGLD